jgi:Sulfotransferase domain
MAAALTVSAHIDINELARDGLMTLPNLLGIGAMRSGTSWLYDQLRSHVDVYMSEQKELNFFNDFYDRGIDWYVGHFPSAKDAVKYRAIGEITPTYMADPDVPARIHALIPGARFIVILRNPVHRAYSEYTKRLRDVNFAGSFDEFIEQADDVLARGYYAEQLQRFFRFFSRDQFLILIFEEAISTHQATIQKLSKFLDIDPKGFDPDRMKHKVNPSYLPRMPRLYASYVSTRQLLVKRNLGRIITTAQKLGLLDAGRSLARFRGPRSELPKIDEKSRERLSALYSREIQNLGALLGRELSIWTRQTIKG